MNVFKLMGLLRDLPRLQEEMKAAMRELAAREFVAEAPGKAVRVVATGAQQLSRVEIRPDLLAEGYRPELQALLAETANQALAEAKLAVADEMQRRFGDKLDLPGMEGMFRGMIS